MLGSRRILSVISHRYGGRALPRRHRLAHTGSEALPPQPQPQPQLTHVGSDGMPNMVDVSRKEPTLRIAHARCNVLLPPPVAHLFASVGAEADVHNRKGPVIATAIVAGVMAAKRTPELIPLCHGISMDDCNITIKHFASPSPHLQVDCITKCWGRTGVEMEAMVGATGAALCVYDMCKALSHDIVISDVKLVSKTGGKREFQRTIT